MKENDVFFSVSDTGILGKRKPECSQQESNLRPSCFPRFQPSSSTAQKPHTTHNSLIRSDEGLNARNVSIFDGQNPNIRRFPIHTDVAPQFQALETTRKEELRSRTGLKKYILHWRLRSNNNIKNVRVLTTILF